MRFLASPRLGYCLLTTLLSCSSAAESDGEGGADPGGGGPSAGQGNGAGTGGSATGGSATGGSSAGGSATAGSAAGGNASAGSATGGQAGENTGAAGGAVDVVAGAAGETSEFFGEPMFQGSGSSTERYRTTEVFRDGVPYILSTNGWGPGFQDHRISWEGTSFAVETMNGTPGGNGEPASYPTVYCGKYSGDATAACGLPATYDSISSLRTGWKWSPNGNEGIYNAAYDIWVGDGNVLQGFLMVWLRDPRDHQPAGSSLPDARKVPIDGLPGLWTIWSGTVNGFPIINWVRSEDDDLYEIEFDLMDLLRDAEARGLTYPGTHVNAVAVGFEIWEGPVTNLESLDFYVELN